MITPHKDSHSGTNTTNGLATADSTSKMPTARLDGEDELTGSTDSEAEDQSAAYTHQDAIQRRRVQNAKFEVLSVCGSFH